MYSGEITVVHPSLLSSVEQGTYQKRSCFRLLLLTESFDPVKRHWKESDFLRLWRVPCPLESRNINLQFRHKAKKVLLLLLNFEIKLPGPLCAPDLPLVLPSLAFAHCRWLLVPNKPTFAGNITGCCKQKGHWCKLGLGSMVAFHCLNCNTLSLAGLLLGEKESLSSSRWDSSEGKAVSIHLQGLSLLVGSSIEC